MRLAGCPNVVDGIARFERDAETLIRPTAFESAHVVGQPLSWLTPHPLVSANDAEGSSVIRHPLRDGGHSTKPVELQFSGSGDDQAKRAITNALAALGRSDEVGGGVSLLLSPRDAFDQGEENTQFLVLAGSETLAELCILIGPNDAAVVLRAGGWGDTQGPEFFLWLVDDFLPFGRHALEVYGAVEFMKVVGRAVERKRYRESRQQAADWVRGGYGPVYGLLKEQVESYHAWAVDDAERQFGLSPADTTKLMTECGYHFERDTELLPAVRRSGRGLRVN
jgi:hypothetical protein